VSAKPDFQEDPTMTGMFVLDPNGKPVPTLDASAWASMMDDVESRRVALDRVGRVAVSTIFLGLDMGIGGEPMFYETRVMGAGDLGDQVQRYRNREDATTGHYKVLAMLKAVRPG
jgi:hypothetical protein